MTTATLSAKGQVLIPKAFRDRLGLHSGDQLEFFVQDGGDLVLRPVAIDVNDAYGMLFKSGRKPVSVEDMNQAVRRHTTRHASP